MLPLIPRTRSDVHGSITFLQPIRAAINKIATVFSNNQQNRTVAGEKLVIESKARRLEQELYKEAAEGNQTEVQKLLAAGVRADISFGSFGETALHVATAHPKILSMLLTTTPRPDVHTRRGETPLYFLLEQTFDTQTTLESLKILLEAGASPNEKGPAHTPLTIAIAREDSLPILRCLIAGGADVGLANKYGNPPLHDAKAAEQVDILLAAGADIEALDSAGATPLISLHTSISAKQRLLEWGANALARTSNGETLTHHLYMSINQLSEQNSLPLPIDVHATDRAGRTPLVNNSRLKAKALLSASGNMPVVYITSWHIGR